MGVFSLSFKGRNENRSIMSVAFRFSFLTFFFTILSLNYYFHRTQTHIINKKEEIMIKERGEGGVVLEVLNYANSEAGNLRN